MYNKNIPNCLETEKNGYKWLKLDLQLQTYYK